MAVHAVAGRPGRVVPGGADAAFEAGDYRTAAVCYARSMQSGQADAAAVYNLAVCWDQTGQPDAARGQLMRLAPLDRDGYGPARFRLVKMALSTDKPMAAELDGAQQQLDRAKVEQPDDAEASFWQAVLWATRGRWDAVAGAAEKAGGLRDVLAGRLAAIAKRQGNPPAAAAWR